jgi:ribonuclease-3
MIGFRPSKLSLYKQAFTHRSATASGSRRLVSNERLEFLGDAVLSLVIGEYLFKKYPHATEGQLSQVRSRVVNRELFNEIGRRMNLAEWLHKTAPHTADPVQSPALLGNAFEALVGAIFLDKGYQQADRFFVKTVLKYHLDFEEAHTEDRNYKSKLLEWSQKEGRKVEFTLKESVREGGQLQFFVEVSVDGEKLGSAKAQKKRKAEQLAAQQAVNALGLG